MQETAQDIPLSLPASYPLHPWRKNWRKKVYYAISPADEELPAQRWPIYFTVWYVGSKFPVITWLLMAGLILVFFLGGSGVDSTSIWSQLTVPTRYGLNTTSVLLKQEYYRLITFAVFHFNALHLISNLVGLWLMGRRLEPAFGRTRMIVLLFFSVLLSGLTWTVLSGNGFRYSIGASGMVYTLLGAALMHILVNRAVLGREFEGHVRNMLMILCVLVMMDAAANIINRGDVQVDIVIHILGFAAGLFITWFIAPRMCFTLLGLDGVMVQIAVDDDNPFRWHYAQIFGVLVATGFVILMLIQRHRWPSIFG